MEYTRSYSSIKGSEVVTIQWDRGYLDISVIENNSLLCSFKNLAELKRTKNIGLNSGGTINVYLSKNPTGLNVILNGEILKGSVIRPQKLIKFPWYLCFLASVFITFLSVIIWSNQFNSIDHIVFGGVGSVLILFGTVMLYLKFLNGYYVVIVGVSYIIVISPLINLDYYYANMITFVWIVLTFIFKSLFLLLLINNLKDVKLCINHSKIKPFISNDDLLDS